MQASCQMPLTYCCMFSLWRGLWEGRTPEEEKGRGRQVLVLLASSWLKALKTQRAHCRVMPHPLPNWLSPLLPGPLGFLPIHWVFFPHFLPAVPSATSSHRSRPSPYLLSKAPLLTELELVTKGGRTGRTEGRCGWPKASEWHAGSWGRRRGV